MGDGSANVDADIASDFVCHRYSQMKTSDVDEARYSKLIEMTERVDKASRVQI